MADNRKCVVLIAKLKYQDEMDRGVCPESLRSTVYDDKLTCVNGLCAVCLRERRTGSDNLREEKSGWNCIMTTN